MPAEPYEWKVSAAGRVNLIGEHIDYCGGKVLPIALSMNNTVYARANGTDKIRLAWTDLPDRAELDTNNLRQYIGKKHVSYPAGCAYFWKEAGHAVPGCDLLLDCTVPFGSGLSSSAAIEVSVIAALCAVSGEPCSPKEAALAAQKAERVFAGVNCGIMDQYASACGKKGCAILLDCKKVEHEYIPLETGDFVFVIANCNKPHSLSESRYNERRAETETALTLLKEKTDIVCLADLTPEAFQKFAPVLPGKIRDRAEHVVNECGRVLRAAAALRNGETEVFGQLLDQSHESLRTLYEVTGRELDSLARAAQSHPGCLGSRMTGGGFGGCTVSLVRKDAVPDFQEHVAKIYERETGYVPSFYGADPSDGIRMEKLR